jgi:hypothetical protein
VLANDSNIFQQPMGGQVLQPGKINNPGVIEHEDPEVQFTARTTESIFGLLTGLGNK